MKELALKIEEYLKQEFPDSYVNVDYSTNLGKAITIKFALERPENWKFGIYMNSRHVTALVFFEGIDLYSYEQASSSFKTRKKNRVDSISILKHIKQQFSKIKEAVIKE